MPTESDTMINMEKTLCVIIDKKVCFISELTEPIFIELVYGQPEFCKVDLGYPQSQKIEKVIFHIAPGYYDDDYPTRISQCDLTRQIKSKAEELIKLLEKQSKLSKRKT